MSPFCSATGPAASARRASTAWGNEPRFVLVHDFDRDGKDDLLTANNAGNNLTFRKGDGAGSLRPPGFFPVDPVSHAAGGDFNGDGRADLAVAAQSGIFILLGTGNESFRLGSKLPLGAFTYVAVVDFNGDARQDLAASSPTQGIRVGLGDGAGGFGPFTRKDPVSPLPAPFVPAAARSIAVADFNADGNADIAGAAGGRISILLGDGKGDFATSEVAVEGRQISVITADLNRDSKGDVVALSDRSDITVLLGDGTGKFSTPVAVGSVLSQRSSDNVQSMAAGDLDGDGNVDLVFPDNSQFSPITGPKGQAVVYLGNGAGGSGRRSPTRSTGTSIGRPSPTSTGTANSTSPSPEGVRQSAPSRCS
ncbi:MAG TPA: VCBS repeat-containing protein [Pyrinomonadaceae bacterium]|nr:VCBS repeat-containing protein [Pyrinomonadaceae bacterium]